MILLDKYGRKIMARRCYGQEWQALYEQHEERKLTQHSFVSKTISVRLPFSQAATVTENKYQPKKRLY